MTTTELTAQPPRTSAQLLGDPAVGEVPAGVVQAHQGHLPELWNARDDGPLRATVGPLVPHRLTGVPGVALLAMSSRVPHGTPDRLPDWEEPA